MVMELWIAIVLIIVFFILGGVAGFFIARFLIKREMKKNPPINENMIRAMFMSMGRKPSEAQIRQVMNSVRKQQ